MAVDYMTHHDLSDDRYLYLFETARKISGIIDVDKIETLSFFKREDFFWNVLRVVKDYFNISGDDLRIENTWEPIWVNPSQYGNYRTRKDGKGGKITVFMPLWYNKSDMIFSAAAIMHEFWHYLQSLHSEIIEYKFTTEKPEFGKLRINGKNKRLLYRYNPLEQEGWFIGYALWYFLDKKTQYKYATKKMKELIGKDDKTVINVLKNKGRMDI